VGYIQAAAEGHGHHMKRKVFFEFDQSCEKWTHQFIKKSSWALPADYEQSDLFNECYIKYLVVVQKYEIQNQRHGMALYMTACVNRFWALRKKRRKQWNVNESVTQIAPLVRRFRGGLGDYGEVILRCEKLSPTLAQLFKNANWDDARALCRKCKVRKDGTRETTNDMMCRLAGVDSTKFDLRGELSEIVYF